MCLKDCEKKFVILITIIKKQEYSCDRENIRKDINKRINRL